MTARDQIAEALANARVQLGVMRDDVSRAVLAQIDAALRLLEDPIQLRPTSRATLSSVVATERAIYAATFAVAVSDAIGVHDVDRAIDRANAVVELHRAAVLRALAARESLRGR